jgi:hypothetical protein
VKHLRIVNSGWIVWNSWVTLFPRMVSPWNLAKCRRSWIGSHPSRCIKYAVF